VVIDLGDASVIGPRGVAVLLTLHQEAIARGICTSLVPSTVRFTARCRSPASRSCLSSIQRQTRLSPACRRARSDAGTHTARIGEHKTQRPAEVPSAGRAPERSCCLIYW
jgi:hypothetical protein